MPEGSNAGLSGGGTALICGAPDGHDVRLIAQLARKRGGAGLLHVALDDARMARVADIAQFFAPDLTVFQVPAWDCLPYDRVSPKPDIVARRVAALTRLAATWPAERPRLVLTTVNAVSQRLPPRSMFEGATRKVAVGARLDLDRLTAYLDRYGYIRAQTVREPGEFALRGGIVDIFPPGRDDPVRIDLFGDEVDTIRVFDALSQRTKAKRKQVILVPMHELVLEDAAIARFRAEYRRLFGAVVAGSDPLYDAVSEARRHQGMEHWLPLFHGQLETLFDYLPDAAVTLDHQSDHALAARREQIAEFYEARRQFLVARKHGDTAVYKPLPPDALYLTEEDWAASLAGRDASQLSPFASTAGAAMDAGGRRGRDFADARANPDVNLYDTVRDHAAQMRRDGRRVVIAGYTLGARERLKRLLTDHGMAHLADAETWEEVEALDPRTVAMAVLPVEVGFAAPDLAVITEQDILGDRLTRPSGRKRKSDAFIAEVSALTPGDLVVHVDHGVGRYEGLETLVVSGAAHDCLRLTYADGDKLFLPVENIEVLSRFGSEEAGAALDKLGGAGWQARKARVKKRLKDMADQLMRIAAAREVQQADSMVSPEGLYQEFSARFPYTETDDQLRAIDDVLGDLGSTRPMDRLVCGDVGFGKTEVALRAAFVAASHGRQVAVVVPTTLLARQHYRTFTERFQGLPIRVGQLSRLVSAKDAKQVRDGLADGTLDVVVGTHALLAKSVKFDRLGLVIVDEEQRFGVKQKERLKDLRANVHVLTLTATPIPRTLQMALSGVRELSLIATPPVDRLAVRTFVLPYDPLIVREAILREHFRGGQTYYVCPRIEDLAPMHEQLAQLVPEAKIVNAHGRMAASQLEDVMSAFYDGQFDVLLSTNIVESGLDVAAANTLIIHRADMFGLAQLYQLRGRIGRSKLRGYAYLTYDTAKPLSDVAKQRLHVIETLESLGAGFTLASHDMDIRGAGNLLGEEQSGHIREVGVELYQQMLQDAVAAAKGGGLEFTEDTWSPQINLGMPVLIPEAYVADLHVRLDIYRRLGRLEDAGELETFAAELIDRFGKLPAEVENLLTLVGLKQLCKRAGVEKLDAGPKGAVVAFRGNRFAHPEKLVAYIQGQAGAAKVRADHKLVLLRAWSSDRSRVDGARKLLEQLAGMAA
ncbi:MAG: transcription-repair coupling factor [Rhodospirillaceae bacterium]|nr:transcription-repair coupling factor [Rhodospirillaceae bacterium]